MESTFYISTDNGENWAPIEVNKENVFAAAPPSQTFTLIDKQDNHMVFVNWQSRHSLVVDVEGDEADNYEVGKSYFIKLGRVES